MQYKKDSGFTLIELMVVVVILGILAVSVIPRLFGQTDQAKRNKAKADIASLEAALRMYRLDNGRYPTTEQGLQALIQQPASGAPRWRKGGYLEKRRIPKDPWKNPYVYLCPGTHNDFDIISYGKDGEPGGSDADKDVTSWDLEEE